MNEKQKHTVEKIDCRKKEDQGYQGFNNLLPELPEITRGSYAKVDKCGWVF